MAQALLALAVAVSPGQAGPVVERTAVITWYDLPGFMANGERVHIGAAACSHRIPPGTVAVLPDGRVVACKDTGLLGDGYWIDIWAPDAQAGHEVALAYPGPTVVRLFYP